MQTSDYFNISFIVAMPKNLYIEIQIYIYIYMISR